MNYKMFLDDERSVQSIYPTAEPDGFIVVRSFIEACECVMKNGCPHFISFDNDLGVYENGLTALEGYDFAKWLVDMSLRDRITIPEDFEFHVHSANPIAVANIEHYLNNYLTFIFQ